MTDLLNSLSLETVERQHIQKVLEHTKWNRTQAAALLGISTKTLYRKIRLYRLVKHVPSEA